MPSPEADTLDELPDPLPVVAVAELPLPVPVVTDELPRPTPVVTAELPLLPLAAVELLPCPEVDRVSTPAPRVRAPPPGRFVELEMPPSGPTVTELDMPPMLEVDDCAQAGAAAAHAPAIQPAANK